MIYSKMSERDQTLFIRHIPEKFLQEVLQLFGGLSSEEIRQESIGGEDHGETVTGNHSWVM